MQAPLTLRPAWNFAAGSLPASSQESKSTSCHPITPLAAHQLELLLLGCSQASSPPGRDEVLDRVPVDKGDDDGLQPHHSSVRCVNPPAFKQNNHDEAVNTLLPWWPVSPSTHDLRSEIALSLTPTNSTSRYNKQYRRCFTYSLDSGSIYSPFTIARSLPAATDASELTMISSSSAPSSPPDLSGSRSSKTSSYGSSSQESTHDGIATDITNFEDIGLNDDKHGPVEETQLRPVRRSKTGEATVKPVPSVSHRPTLPSLQNQVREAIKQKGNGSPLKRPMAFASLRRGVSSPITPSAAGIETARPRSSSPRKQTSNSQSSTVTFRPQMSSSRTSLPLPSRRGSWQRRKSVQELEAEYHDSDDDLPEDASLWNVPVSPHPGDRSAGSSFCGSPAREPLARSPMPISLSHATTAPDATLRSPPNGQNLPRTRPGPPRSSSLTTSLSNPSSPRSKRFQRAGRAKSWNLAMEDLSEEAKIISEALDNHAESSRRAQLEGSHANSSGESLGANTRTKAGYIQLPPIQKSNLDFMPISKEKEAILSRTRPSWLPPKDPTEERRHLKEYQRMMAASLEAEKKRTEKLRSQECEKDNTRDVLNRVWHYFCEETTDLSTIDQRVFTLCWRGIPPKLRGKVWQRAIGNQLGLTSKSYEKALSRAHEIQSHESGNLSKSERRMNGWFKDIERDAETAFPELNVFQRNGPLWQDLMDVCKAYACYRSDIGYLYGHQLTAALLLLQVHKPADAFVLLANSFNRIVPLAFQTGEFSTVARTYNHAVSTLAIKFPRLHEYIFGSIEEGGLGFTAELIFEPMLRTLFCNGMDIDRLCRFWDLWVFENDKALVRTAVAILGCLQSQLFEIQGDVDLRRRNIQEMLAWGPFNRTTKGGQWDLNHVNEDRFVEEIRIAGELNYQLK